MTRPQVLRLAIALELLGLAFVPGVLVRTTPGTFLALAFLGVPLVGCGVVIYLVHVTRELVRRSAL
ncbi:MAG: hypothetical protein U0610_16255 [bacterium]